MTLLFHHVHRFIHTIDVEVNFSALAVAPDSLDIELPDSTIITVTLKDFSYRRGYEFRDEDDPPGPPIYITPGFPLDDMSYKWSGGNDQWDVLLSVTRGTLYGIITSNQKRYGISQVADDYFLVDYNLSAFRPLDEDTLIAEEISVGDAVSAVPFEDQTSVSDLKSYAPTALDITAGSDTEQLNSNAVLDVLIVWTEDARIEAGGNPGNLNDTEDIGLDGHRH